MLVALDLFLLPCLAAVEPPPSSVGTFDAAGMALVMGGEKPAFVKFEFLPCDYCTALNTFWDKLSDLYPGVVWRVDCNAHPDVCEARSVKEDPTKPPHLREPIIKFWTGSGFRRYSGELQPKPLLEYLQRKLTPQQNEALLAEAQQRAMQQQREQQQQQQRQQQIAEERAQRAAQGRRTPNGPADAALFATDADWKLQVLFFCLGGLFTALMALAWWLGRFPNEQPGTFVIVGTYTQSLDHVDGKGDGLYIFRLHEETGSLTPASCIGVGVPNLSYLCAEPPRRIKDGWQGAYVLHAASECQPEGSILTLQFDPRHAPCLKVLDHISAGGAQTCHVGLVHPTRRAAEKATSPSPLLLASNYGDGTVAVLGPQFDRRRRRVDKMTRHAVLRPPADKGSNAVPARQGSPHAHHCEAVRPPQPGGGAAAAEEQVLITDLGCDSVAQYALGDEAGGAPLRLVGSFSAPAGSGPRHVAAHPAGTHAYCVCELDCHMLVLALRSDAPPKQLQRVPLLATTKAAKKGAPSASASASAFLPTASEPAASAVRVSADGKHIYAAVRGADVIVTLRIEKGGERVVVAGRTPCGDASDLTAGDEDTPAATRHTPRDLVLAGQGEGVLLVANQDSHRIVSFRRDAASGQLERLCATENPSPCALLPLAWPPQKNR